MVLENEMAFKENKNMKKKKKHLYAVFDSLLQILEKKVVLASEMSQSSNGESGIQDSNVDNNTAVLLPKFSSGN